MRAIVVAFGALASCYQPAGDLPCTVSCEHAACPGNLECDSRDQLCRAPGANACTQVDANDANDGPRVDAAANCYGVLLFPDAPICVDVTAGPLNVTMAKTVDTMSTECAPQIAAYCVIAYEQIEIAASIRATGARPLVLIASGKLHVATSGTVDAASRHAVPTPTAAGVDAALTRCASTNAGGAGIDGGAGGGAGGSFGGQGGVGGLGDGSMANGGVPGATSPASAIRAGCPGGRGGAGISSGGAGGAGGGAIALLAHGDIIVEGQLVAFGAGGSSQLPGSVGDRVAAGGGGSGGLIAIEGNTVHLTTTSLVLASGAGGAGAGGVNGTPGSGSPGGEPMSATAASGGASFGAGGAGGAGSSKAQLDGNPGGPGTTLAGGGGGGGGGAGWLRIQTPDSAQLTIDPAATIAPARTP